MFRKLRRRHLLLLALWIGGGIIERPAGAQDRTITWLTMEFAPFYIHEGADRGQGIADRVTRIVQARMPGWTHAEEVASPAEIVRRMRAGEGVCSAAYIRTPSRERMMEFSLPDLVLPPNGITVRRSDLARFGGGNAVSLRRLAADPTLKVAYAQGRSYGNEIDAILGEHRNEAHVYGRIGDDIYRSLFDLLIKGSVDYVVGYPYEAVYVASQQGVADQVVSLPIEENRAYTLAHVVCPRTPWGRRVIDEIDGILREVRPTEEYRQAIERWISPEMLGEFRERYDDLFLAATPAE